MDFESILVATDMRYDGHPLVEEAAEVARHNRATLKIVDVVPDLPWRVRRSLDNAQHLTELLVREKSEQLEQLAAGIRDDRLEVTTKVLQGATSLEIIREVLREKHDLVMRITKAPGSRRRGFFGTTGTRLLRRCPCAVWLVRPETAPRFAHVLACVDTASEHAEDIELNERVYRLASSISQYQGGRLSILHAWYIWNEQMLKGRMGDEQFAAFAKRDRAQVTELLDKFLRPYGTDSSAENVHLIQGEPHDVIPRFAAEAGADLVILGTIARAGLSGLIMGNTAEMTLDRLECSVLAVKPRSFHCPIRLDD